MHSRQIIISPPARKDLREIWAYIAQRSTAWQASRVAVDILDSIYDLAKMPGVGHFRADIPAGYHAWSVFRYIIIYHFDPNRVYIDRILHGNRNFRRIMLK